MQIHPIGVVLRTYRHINRYRQILTVLMRYGFADLLDRLHIAQYVELGLQLIGGARHEQGESLSTPQRVRMVLEELGPTFIKLGQILSTRPDVLPAEFIDELSKLQQHVPSFEFSLARGIVEAELQRPLPEVYQQFDPQPLAAGSIAQVHGAVLRDGGPVVVKVQRPNIRESIAADLEILLHLATLAERHFDGLRVQRPTAVVQEFSRLLEHELDFLREAGHLERFRRQFRGDGAIRVPRVERAATARRVLTMERMDLAPIMDLDELLRRGLNPRVLAQRGARVTLEQIFVHGFFHADPHPGNVFALPGNVICLLDFGLMGRLDRRLREDFAELIYAVAERDVPQVAAALLRLAEYEPAREPDRRQLEHDVAEFIDTQVVDELKELDLGRLLYAMLDLLNRYALRIPTDLITMVKAAATVERIAGRLDPSLNMLAEARPYVRRVRLERLRPRRLVRDLLESTGEFARWAREIPGSIRDLLGLAKRGELRIGFEHRGLDRLIDSNERIANRVSFAIVVAALIVASSLIVPSQIPPLWFEIPIIGLAGYIVAGWMAVTLFIAIIRHGRL